MKARILLGWVAVVVLTFTAARAAAAFEATHRCPLENGKREVKIDLRTCRPIGTGHTPSPTPSPTPKPTAAQPCTSIEVLPKVKPNEYGGEFTFAVGEKQRCLAFDLPSGVPPGTIVRVSTINRGNSSCGELELTVKPPGEGPKVSFGSQPGVPAFAKGNEGRWFIYPRLAYGCSRYRVYATW